MLTEKDYGCNNLGGGDQRVARQTARVSHCLDDRPRHGSGQDGRHVVYDHSMLMLW